MEGKYLYAKLVLNCYSTRRIYAYRIALIRHNGEGVDDMNTQTPLDEWVTKEQLAVAHPALNLSQLKYLIRSRKCNGLSDSGAVSKVGGRMLIHKNKFATWIASKTC